MPDPIELTPNSLKEAAQKGTEELRGLLESVQESGDQRKGKVDRAREALRLLREEQQQQFSDEERRAIVEASRQVIQEALDAVTEELQKAAGAKLKELEEHQQSIYDAKTEALELEKNLISLAGRAGVEWRELKLYLKHASTKEKAYLAGVGAVAGGITLWVWSKIWGSREKPGALRQLGGLIAAAAAGIAGVLMFRKRGPGGKDSLWKKMIEKAPAPVQAVAGAVAGAGSKVADRVGEQAEIASHLPAMVYEWLVNGDYQAALDHGWVFVKGEFGWAVTNLKEMYQVPLQFVESLSDEKLSTYECAAIYGEAGVSYYLGRGTLKALLTGKIALPHTGRSLGMAVIRTFAWPGAVVRDTVNLGILTFSDDGHVIARTTVSRMYGRGLIQDLLVRHLAKTGKLENIQRALQHYQLQNRRIAVLGRNLEGPLRGHVSAESLRAIQNANQHLAEDLARIGAPKLRAQLQAAGQPVPSWLEELERVGKLSDQGLVRDGVDKAASKLFSESGGAIDDVQRVLARGNATIPEILRASGATVEDVLSMGNNLDDVCRVLNGMDDLDGAVRMRHVTELLMTGGTADELVKAGIELEHVTKALGGLDDEMRLFHVQSLFESGQTVENLYRAGVQPADILRARADAVAELHRLGVRGADLLAANASIDDLLKAGLSAEDLAKIGVKSSQILESGADDALRAVVKFRPVAEAMDAIAGLGDDAARAAGYRVLFAEHTVEYCVKAGVEPEALLKAGQSVSALYEAGVGAGRLAGAGVQAQQLLDAGIDLAEITPHVPADQLLNTSISLDDLAEVIVHIDDVTVRQARLAELVASSGDTVPARLLGCGAQADELLTAGARPALVIDATLNMQDDALRMAAMGEVLTTEHADELVKAIASSGNPQLARDVQAVVEVAGEGLGLSDDVARSVGALSAEAAETTARAGRAAEDVLPEGARAAAGAEGLTHAAPAAAASDAAESTVRLYRPQVAEQAQRALRESMGISDFEMLMRHKPTRVLLEGDHADEVARLVTIGFEEGKGLAGAKNVARYLLAIGDDAPVALRAPEVIRMVSTGGHGNASAIGRFLINGARAGGEVTTEGCVKAIKQMTRWQQAGKGMRTLYFAGLALEVGMVGWDYYNVFKAAESTEETMLKLRNEFSRIGLQPSADNPDVYEGFGVEVDISILEPTALDSAVAAYAIDASALALTIVAPSLVLGPVGLAVAGVVISAHIAKDTIVSARKQRRHLEFLSSAPAWLLAILGTEGTIRQTAYDTVREYNGVILSDIVPTTPLEVLLSSNPGIAVATPLLRENREGMKRQARENAMLAQMYRRFARYYGEYIPELPHEQDGSAGGIGPMTLFDSEGEFMEPGGDFERIVRPYLILRLHAETKGENVAFAATERLDLSERQGGFSDWLMGLGFPVVSEYELDDALEEAMMLEVWHMREKRHWARMDSIKRQVEKERKRLAAIEGMPEEVREERMHLYREALEEAYEDEIEYDPDFFYIFNTRPKNIPRREDGKTWAEAVVQERMAWASRVRTDLSAEEAGSGFSLPWVDGGRAMSIRKFARDYVRPKKLESVRLRMEKNSPPQGEPFSYQELEAMGHPQDPDAEWNAEQFRRRFTEAIAPLERVNNVFTQTMTNDEQLKRAVSFNRDAINFYVQFAEHADYYRDYLRHWRGVSMPLPLRLSPEFVQLLRTWANSGYPTLIDEKRFSEMQAYARTRSLAPSVRSDRTREGDLMARLRGRGRSVQLPKLSLPGDVNLPGYDMDREGVLLFSYRGYAFFQERHVQRVLGDRLLRRMDIFPLRDGSSAFPFVYGTSGGEGGQRGFGLSLPREGSIRKKIAEMNGSYVDKGGTAIPLATLSGRTDLIALKPDEVRMLFSHAVSGVKEGVVRLPVNRKKDSAFPSAMHEFLPLQQYLLQSRLFIVYDPQPDQPQLPLDLSGTSVRIVLPPR